MAEIHIKASSSDSSSTFVSDLPSSLIVEILIKLPLKSIVRFQSVCKSWKNLISDKYFSSHYSKNTPITFLLHFEYHKYGRLALHPIYFDFVEIGLNRNISFTQTNLPSNVSTTRSIRSRSIVSSSNGLLCFVISEHREYEVIYIMNPIFGDFLMLPRIYHPCGYCHEFGFGYCTQSDHYKVISIYRKSYESNIVFEIFTMGVDTKWRPLELDSSCKFKRLTDGSGITHEGVVYFVFQGHSYANFGSYNIFAFDLEKEKGRLIPIPYEPSDQFYLYSLSLWEGNLCLIQKHSTEYEIEIWTMKQCEIVESWSKSILKKPCNIIEKCYPFTKLRNGDLLWSGEDNSILSYNEKTKMIDKVDKPPKEEHSNYDRFFEYIPNFVPLRNHDIEEKYCESLDLSNVLDILEISETCSYRSLKEAALNFIVRNMKDVFFSSRFEAFVSKNPHLTVQITRALSTATNYGPPVLESSPPQPQQLDNISSEMNDKTSISFGSLNQPVFVSRDFSISF